MGGLRLLPHSCSGPSSSFFRPSPSLFLTTRGARQPKHVLPHTATLKLPPWNMTTWQHCLLNFHAAGNVVALNAARKGSVCGFQLDHIFPWSRGGLTVEANLMALHWCVLAWRGLHDLHALLRACMVATMACLWVHVVQAYKGGRRTFQTLIFNHFL